MSLIHPLFFLVSFLRLYAVLKDTLLDSKEYNKVGNQSPYVNFLVC